MDIVKILDKYSCNHHDKPDDCCVACEVVGDIDTAKKEIIKLRLLLVRHETASMRDIIDSKNGENSKIGIKTGE